MVNDERAGDARVHGERVPAARHHRVAHGGEVGEDGNAGEVLEEHTGGHELHLAARLASEAGGNHGLSHAHGVLVGRRTAHHVLQEHHEGAREPLDTRYARDQRG